MHDADSDRLAGSALMIGAAAALVFNVLHPRATPTRATETQLRLAGETSYWTADHLGIAIAVCIVTAGLLLLSRALAAGPGGAWAVVAGAGAIVGLALMVVLMTIDGVVLRHLTRIHAAAPAADKPAWFAVATLLKDFDYALLAMWTLEFLGLTVIAYGLALVASVTMPRWLGISAVVLGLVGVVDGAAMAFDLDAFVWFNLVFSAVSLLFTLWTFAAGVVIRRHAGKLVL